MTTITTTEIFADANVAGGWTEHDTVARRICTALWKATGAFGRITNYHSDVVIDCLTIQSMVAAMEPGTSVEFTYVVGVNGTHLWQGVNAFRSEHVLGDDRGGNTGRFTVSLTRSDLQTTVYGQTWGADKYGLTISEITLPAA